MNKRKIEVEVPVDRLRFDVAIEVSALIGKGTLLLHHSRDEVVILEPMEDCNLEDPDIVRVLNSGWQAELLDDRRTNSRSK